jgi:hypothetical protein
MYVIYGNMLVGTEEKFSEFSQGQKLVSRTWRFEKSRLTGLAPMNTRNAELFIGKEGCHGICPLGVGTPALGFALSLRLSLK